MADMKLACGTTVRVGMKVECVEGYCSLKAGKIYTVSSIDNVHIGVAGIEDGRAEWLPFRFRSAPQTAPSDIYAAKLAEMQERFENGGWRIVSRSTMPETEEVVEGLWCDMEGEQEERRVLWSGDTWDDPQDGYSLVEPDYWRPIQSVPAVPVECQHEWGTDGAMELERENRGLREQLRGTVKLRYSGRLEPMPYPEETNGDTNRPQ